MTATTVGYRDTTLDLEPSVIVCAPCVAGYDVSDLFVIVGAEAREYGDECQVCGEDLASLDREPLYI